MSPTLKTLALSVASVGVVGGALFAGTSVFGSAVAAPESTSAPSASAAATGAAVSPLNNCPNGTVPLLDIKDNAHSGESVGEPTVEDAVASLLDTPAARLSLTVTSMAAGNDSAPRWVTARDTSYVVNPAPDGGWLASEATFVECQKLKDAVGGVSTE